MLPETLAVARTTACWRVFPPHGRIRRSPGSVPCVDPRELSDAELARGIACGSAPVLERELVLRFRPRVVLFAKRHTRDAALSEDIAQDVLTTVLERLRSGGVDDPERIGSFILSTARWTVHGKRRQERRAQEITDTLALEAPRDIEPRSSLDAEALERALLTLPRAQASVGPRAASIAVVTSAARVE